MVIILDKHVIWCCNFIAGHIYMFIVVWNLIWCLKLDLKLKSLSSTQNIFNTSEFSGRSGLKLVNFGLLLNCFSLVRSGENIIGSLWGRSHKIYNFLVRSGSGQYGVGVPKTLPRRTLCVTQTNFFKKCHWKWFVLTHRFCCNLLQTSWWLLSSKCNCFKCWLHSDCPAGSWYAKLHARSTDTA